MTPSNDAVLYRLDRMLEIMEVQAAMQMLDLEERVSRRPISKAQLIRINRLLYPTELKPQEWEALVSEANAESDRTSKTSGGNDAP